MRESTVCKEVMTTEPVCCFPNESAETAAQLMKLEDVGCIPVVADEDSYELIGILTDRDLAVEVVAAGLDPSHVRVSEIMKANPHACREDEDVIKVLETMSAFQIRRVPVIDRHKRVVGIIAQRDIATRLNNRELTGAVVERISR